MAVTRAATTGITVAALHSSELWFLGRDRRVPSPIDLDMGRRNRASGEERAALLLPDDPKTPRESTAGDGGEDKYERARERVMQLLRGVQRGEYELQVHEWSSSEIKSTSDDQLLKITFSVMRDKCEIRAILKRLAEMNRGGPTWEHVKEDDNGQIDLEQVSCTYCGLGESYDDNDILLCDKAGCFRAFHQNCMEPPLETSNLPAGEDSWFCHQCSCQIHCLGVLMDVYGSDFETWESVFPDCASEDVIESKMAELRAELATHSNGNGAASRMQLPEDDDYDEDEDEDFDPEVERAKQREREEQRAHISAPSDSSGSSSGDNETEPGELSYASGDSDTSVDDFSDGELKHLKASKADIKAGKRQRLDFAARSEDSFAHGADLLKDHGAFDVRNVMSGQRKRTKVDYVRLNQAMFGSDEDSDIDGSETDNP